MQRSTFRQVATIAGLICLGLALAWLFEPGWLLRLFGLADSVAVGVLARRMAALFLGVAVLLLAARGAPPGTARDAISKGLVVACASLAVLGIVDAAAGRAGPGILLAATVEVTLGIGFALSLRT